MKKYREQRGNKRGQGKEKERDVSLDVVGFFLSATQFWKEGKKGKSYHAKLSL